MPAPLNTQDDELLIKAVIRGDTTAFRHLVNRYDKLVCSIVFKMVEGREDREDICQEVFLKVYDKLTSFRFEAKLSTWIGNVAFNTSINHLRKKKVMLVDDVYRTHNAEEDDEANTGFQIKDDARSPEELLSSKERIQLLLQSMEKLSPVQRTLISLFHQQELSLEEISVITALPVNTIKSYLHRGRQVLKNEMLKRINH